MVMASEGTTHTASPANLWLLADLPHLIGSGRVGSMPLSRTQKETADLFEAACVQESCRTHTPARLTSAQRSAAAVSGAEKLSSQHVLYRIRRSERTRHEIRYRSAY